MTADTNPAAVTGDGETWYLIIGWNGIESIMPWDDATRYLGEHPELASMGHVEAAAWLLDAGENVRIVTRESPEFQELVARGLTTDTGVTAWDRTLANHFANFKYERQPEE